ncbi:MAG: hypothetical protein OXF06_03950 [Bacteroidetes bacterium]|nr:hypothetical protein [Bacteroidota bacterium]
MAGRRVMTINLDRLVRQIHPIDKEWIDQQSYPLQHFASEDSYVILGEPGMGKTTEFRKEAERVHGLCIPVRRFIHQDTKNHPEWKSKTLFLDGLDEARMGSGNPRDVIHKVVSKLEDLAIPKFRISCRANGWMGRNDLDELASLFNHQPIPVLQLLPLSHNDIRQILTHHGKNPDQFIQLALQNGLDPFLKNPQLLSLLLKSSKADVWCQNPKTVFSIACKELVKEHNHEYDLTHGSTLPQPDHDTILKDAGKLCVLLLIANKMGWSTGVIEDSDLLSLRDVNDSDDLTLRIALNSALFEGTAECRTPTHRLLAEFIGAHYLHNKIQEGVSVQRIFSLFLSPDGIPFADLRGLAAWLASLNQKVRSVLIDADPIAIAFYGDVSNFSRAERTQLLKNLEEIIDLEAPRISLASMGALAGEHGMQMIWELCHLPERNKNRQTLISILLQGIIHMNANAVYHERLVSDKYVQENSKHLQQIIYDSSWNQYVRSRAITLLSQLLPMTTKRSAILIEILQDLEEHRLKDEEGYLYWALLQTLYPDTISPTEIWNYLLKLHLNQVQDFFFHLIDGPEKSHIHELIHSLCSQPSDVIPMLCEYNIGEGVPKLLARGLNLCGHLMDVDELYRWFELAELDEYSFQFIPKCNSDQRYLQRDRESTEQIFRWLNEHHTIQIRLIEHDLKLRESEIGSDEMIGLKFIGIPPQGFRLKCLFRATELCKTSPMIAEKFALWSTEIYQGWEDPLMDDIVEEVVTSYPILLEWNNKRLLEKNQRQQRETERNQQQAIKQAEIHEKRDKKLDHIRQQIDDLSNGSCNPILMDELAGVYFSAMNHPRHSLESYMNGDQDLIEATLSGFRSLLNRDDLPDLDQIADLHENSRRSYFARPYLAGIQEEESDHGQVLEHLDDRGLRRLLGFHMVTDVPRFDRIDKPRSSLTWFDEVLSRHPKALADCLVAIHQATVRSKTLPNQHLYQMVDNPKYFKAAQLAVSRMFSVFPTRCSGHQLDSLRVVLWNVILKDTMPKDDVWKIASERLERQKIDLHQKAIWLCTGLIVAKDECLPLFIDFLSTGQETRIYHVFDFLITSGSREFILKDLTHWNSDELSLVIKAIAKHGKSLSLNEGPYLIGDQPTLRLKISPITPWVEEFSRRDDDQTACIIEDVLTDPNLKTWRDEIRRAQRIQAHHSRMGKHRELIIGQIQKTLRNGPPSSAADLLSMTTHVLDDLSDRIRNGQTNDWRQYWNWDHQTKKPASPKHENDCRDLLLSDLKLILNQKDIDAQPEGFHAGEKRSDIRISYLSDFSIPIEIKKNSHRKIWHGISEQLIPKYTRDPNCDGYGIYLVLWFGASTKYMKMLSPAGGVPKTPEDLKSMLLKQLAPEYANRINVVVMDVSLSSKYSENKHHI